MKTVDYHIHTNLSDGKLSIDEIINISKKNKYEAIAITDHDLISDCENYNEDIEIINGIEFSTSIKGLHILGYGIRDISEINKFLENLKSANHYIALQLIKKLQEQKYNISVDLLYQYLLNNKIETQYLNKRDIVKYLIDNGYANTILEVYERIIGRNTSNYIPVPKSMPQEVIELILKCNGISILAHPNTLMIDKVNLEKFINELKSFGLSGIETYNSNSMNESEFVFYDEFADKHNLIKTVGSDFHSIDSQKIGINIDDDYDFEFLESIHNLRKIRKR